MHGNPAELSIDDLALTRVQAGSDLDPQLGDLAAYGRCALDATRRSVERREEPVAGRIQFPPAMPGQLTANERMVALDDLPPPCVAHLRQASRRIDDVREEDRRQHPVGPRLRPA